MNLDEFRQHYGLRKSARPIDSYESMNLGVESGLRILSEAPVSDVVFGRPPKHAEDRGRNTYLWVIDRSGIPYLIEGPLKILNERLPKHTNLTGGGPAYVGGQLWFRDTSTLYVSGGSGRFPPLNEGQLDAAVSVFESFSYAVSSLGWNPGTGYPRRILQEF